MEPCRLGANSLAVNLGRDESSVESNSGRVGEDAESKPSPSGPLLPTERCGALRGERTERNCQAPGLDPH